jgi:hypothetical protein
VWKVVLRGKIEFEDAFVSMVEDKIVAFRE